MGRGEGDQQHLRKLPVPLMLAFGATAGLIAQTVTYPLDVVRRQMQVPLPVLACCLKSFFLATARKGSPFLGFSRRL